MPVPRVARRFERLLRFGVIAGLLALALVPAVLLRKSFALAQGGWQAGQYRDTNVTTRSGTKQLALGETAVQRPRLQPGEAATLRASYEVPESSQVRETRIIRYDGLVLARIERVIARPGGNVLSEYRVDVPRRRARAEGNGLLRRYEGVGGRRRSHARRPGRARSPARVGAQGGRR